MKNLATQIAKEIFTTARLQAFFRNPPPEGPTDAGDLPATEEIEGIIDEIADMITEALGGLETTVASLKSVTQDHVRRLKDLEESRKQAITELEAARKTSDATLAREDEARKAAVKSKAERLKTVKELGQAVSARERYKNERDALTTTVRQANEKIRQLMEDREATP